LYAVRKTRTDAALKFLADVASGRAALDIPSSEGLFTNPASPDEVLRGSSTKPDVFSDTKLAGY